MLLTSSECIDKDKKVKFHCGPNDIWSLGVVLLNLTCGQNPWKQASLEDSTYRAFSANPGFLQTILPLSDELNEIVQRIFEYNPQYRVDIFSLKTMIRNCRKFTGPIKSSVPRTPVGMGRFDQNGNYIEANYYYPVNTALNIDWTSFSSSVDKLKSPHDFADFVDKLDHVSNPEIPEKPNKQNFINELEKLCEDLPNEDDTDLSDSASEFSDITNESDNEMDRPKIFQNYQCTLNSNPNYNNQISNQQPLMPLQYYIALSSMYCIENWPSNPIQDPKKISFHSTFSDYIQAPYPGHKEIDDQQHFSMFNAASNGLGSGQSYSMMQFPMDNYWSWPQPGTAC